MSLLEQRQLKQKEWLENRRLAQLNGTQATIQGNQDSKYQLPEDEAGLIHLQLKKFRHVEGTEQVTTLSQIVKLDVRAYEKMEKTPGTFANWDKQEILHDGRVKPEAKKTKKAE